MVKVVERMKIYPNKVYRSINDEAVVMPIATLGDEVQLYVGQQFGTRVLFMQNRRTTMKRDEFLANFKRDDEQ